MKRPLELGLLAIVVAAVACVAWLLMIYPRAPKDGAGRETAIEISVGESAEDLIGELAAAKVIESPTLFAIYMRILGADQALRIGSVVLSDRLSPAEVVRAIAIGFGPSHVRVTIPEGFTRFDIADRLAHYGVCDAQAFLASTSDPTLLAREHIAASSAEGYLFPDTYELTIGLAASDVVHTLVANFRRRTAVLVREEQAGLTALQRQLGFTLHEAVILASVVEKEAARDEERPIIARVFINRMTSETFRPRRLQADPTVSYGCRVQPDVSPACEAFDGRRITRAMLDDGANPYNTYRIDGLPPGPIGNPGLSALRAVLAPARHDYLYFVARGGGRHAFSATLEEHNAAVARYRSQ